MPSVSLWRSWIDDSPELVGEFVQRDVELERVFVGGRERAPRTRRSLAAADVGAAAQGGEQFLAAAGPRGLRRWGGVDWLITIMRSARDAGGR